MPTPQEVIARLRQDGNIHLPSGIILPLASGNRFRPGQTPRYAQFKPRFGRAFHYEVVFGKKDHVPDGHLHVRFDLEPGECNDTTLRQWLLTLREPLWSIAKTNGLEPVKSRAKTTFQVRLSDAISCDNQTYEQIKDQIVNGLQRLYDIFDETLQRAEKEMALF